MAFPYWLTVNPTSGTGPGRSTITVSPFTGRYYRGYTMTVSGMVGGKPAATTAVISQDGTYKAAENVEITSDDTIVNTTERTNDDGSTVYEISSSDWESKDSFTINFSSNANGCCLRLSPTEAYASFDESKPNTITYIDDTGTTTSTSLGLTSTMTAFYVSSVLPFNFDPGKNGTYNINFSISPKEKDNIFAYDVVKGVSIRVSSTTNSTSTLLEATPAAIIGANYPGITGITPSFQNGGSELDVPESGATTPLYIDCATGVEWTIS